MAGENTRTYKVELHLQIAGQWDRSAFDDLSVNVMEALDEHTSDAILGAAATIDYEVPALEIEIDVSAAAPSQLHGTLADVFRVLEDHAGVRSMMAASRIAEKARPEPEHHGDLVPV